MKKPFNGHESWNAWNVSLWISNDEPIYRAAVEAKKRAKTLRSAARRLSQMLPQRTPDGARYSIHSIALALRDL